MSENTEKNESVIKKFGGWFGLVVAAVAALFFLDQGEIFGETVPAGWTRLKQVLAGGSKKVQKVYWQSAIWLKDHLKFAKRVTLVWWTIAGALLFAGIVGKLHGWDEDTSLALRLVGIYLFAGYWFLVAGLAKPIYLGVHALMRGAKVAAAAVGQTVHDWLGHLDIETPVPAVEAKNAEKLEEGAKSFQRFFFTIAALTLILGTFFAPSGEPATAVKLALVGMPLAALSAIASKFGWKSEFGWKMIGIAVLIGFVVLTFTVFGTTLVPAPIRNWFSGRNQSELIALVLFAVPVTLWLMAAFWKGKSAEFSKAAKVVTYVSAAMLVFLWIKGPVNSKDLTGHQTSVDEVKRDLGITKTAPQQPASSAKGTYMAPPAGATGNAASQPNRSEAHQPQETVRNQPRRARIVVPPAEAPKHYTNPAQAMNDLDDTGY